MTVKFTVAMHYLTRLLLLGIVMVSFSGCLKMYKPDINWGTHPFAMRMNDPPEGPPEYQQGWKDGCESGYGGYGEFTAKVFYDFRQDPNLVQNPTYYRAWKDAYTYCASFGNMTTVHGLGNFR